ncbi:uncharacterized protein BKA78DRAFT_323176 [Phyllosticta capitalensis]|uniref:uncharacterized protein n=1 Tax=Phyllosticta capitalensis TaxID=121624 RepID=UPI00312D0881
MSRVWSRGLKRSVPSKGQSTETGFLNLDKRWRLFFFLSGVSSLVCTVLLSSGHFLHACLYYFCICILFQLFSLGYGKSKGVRGWVVWLGSSVSGGRRNKRAFSGAREEGDGRAKGKQAQNDTNDVLRREMH